MVLELEPRWAPASAHPVLAVEEVHVWRIGLDWPGRPLEELAAILSADELAKATRFHFRRDRERFIVARGVLRVLLARYIGREPASLRFRAGPAGKPTLATQSCRGGLRFNMSHSDGLALYAMSRGREVGVDLERILPGVIEEEIAERFFSPREVVELCALPKGLQVEAFFRCYTRKEAYLKARGEGLSIPLNQFSVSLAHRAPAALLSSDGDAGEVLNWSLQELAPGPGYMAALAVEGKEWHVKLWRWPDFEGQGLSPQG